jgi:hypothetical protein
MGRSVDKLTSDNGLTYVESKISTYEGYSRFNYEPNEDPLSSAFIKLRDPEAFTPHDTLLLRVRNPVTIFELPIQKALTQKRGNVERRDEMLRRSLFDRDGESGRIKPTVEISLIQADAPYAVDRPGARIRFEWDMWQDEVVTRGHVPGRNDRIPDKIPGKRKHEVPVVSFARMRSGIIFACEEIKEYFQNSLLQAQVTPNAVTV